MKAIELSRNMRAREGSNLKTLGGETMLSTGFALP